VKRVLLAGLMAVGCWAAAATETPAQVLVRVPFVRVQVGPGVDVRAPFFSFSSPPSGPILAPGPAYVYPQGYVIPPPSVYIPPTPPATVPPVDVVPPAPAQVPSPTVPPPPPPPPAPATGAQAMTLDQFSKQFQPKAGTYDLDLLNPVTGQPTRVKFTLPEGTPKRVIVRNREIEFFYGIKHFVRIEFDREGAIVTTR
jgi:hypothetical protein